MAHSGCSGLTGKTVAAPNYESTPYVTSEANAGGRSGAKPGGIGSYRLRRRRPVAECAVGPDAVVFMPPPFHQHFRLIQRIEELLVQ